MSTTVKSFGFIAALTAPIQDSDIEDIQEFLYDNRTGIHIGRAGALVYIDYNTHVTYSERENIYGIVKQPSNEQLNSFVKECKKYGIKIDVKSVKPYTCIWYNGSDSDMAMLTLEEFLKW